MPSEPDGVDLGVATKQRPNFGFTEPAMAAGGADAADPTGCRPARHGLRIDPKQTGNLSGCQEAVTVLHLLCLSFGTRC